MKSLLDSRLIVARHGEAWHGWARYGLAGVARRGMARNGKARPGMGRYRSQITMVCDLIAAITLLAPPKRRLPRKRPSRITPNSVSD